MNNKILKTAAKAARSAGRRLWKEFQSFDRGQIELKARREIVTPYDCLSEKMIVRAIRRDFPKHAILAEEGGGHESGSEYLWAVDPLDGTTNFSIHNPLWAVSIGVFRGQDLVAGAVYAPALDELFSAAKGQGAFLNGRPLTASKIARAKEMHTFCHGRGRANLMLALRYYNYQKINGFDCRQLGSAALELCYVAAGRLESIMIPGDQPWDLAAGALIAREAGARVSDFSGKPWQKGSRNILASNGLCHARLLDIISKCRRCDCLSGQKD